MRDRNAQDAGMTSRNTLLTALAVLLPLAAAAQPVDGPYVSLGAGVDFLQNEMTRPVNALHSNLAYRFDPGPAGFAAAGYGLGNGLRLEVEGDYAYNHVRGIKSVAPERAGGYQQQYGGFVNALYDFDLDLPIYPFVGAGVGYQAVELDGFNQSQPGFAAPGFNGSGPGQTAGDFAYQGIAGVSYPLDFVPGLSLTAEYRFIGVTALDYVRTSFNAAGPIGRSTRTFDDIFSHEILVGVRYAFYTPAPPPSVEAPPAPPPPEAARTYLVFFDWDKASLTDRARQIVAQAAQASTRVQTTRIEVNGYTDTSGTPKYNQGLSVRRADAVAAELVRDGVPKAEISIHGYGETRLLVQTGPGVREPQNRRVEIILR
jgi:opacity protein-like surface antigen